VFCAGGIATAQSHTFQMGAQVIDQTTHGGSVVLEIG
jgi:hypothetical protein